MVRINVSLGGAMRSRQYIWLPIDPLCGPIGRSHKQKSAPKIVIFEDMLEQLLDELYADFSPYTSLGSGVVRYDLKLLHAS